MHDSLAILVFSITGISLFIGGFFAGIWINRHNTRIIELPKVEIVRVPEYVTMPTPAPAAAPRQTGGTFSMIPDPRTPTERVTDAAMGELITDLGNMGAEL